MHFNGGLTVGGGGKDLGLTRGNRGIALNNFCKDFSKGFNALG